MNLTNAPAGQMPMHPDFNTLLTARATVEKMLDPAYRTLRYVKSKNEMVPIEEPITVPQFMRLVQLYIKLGAQLDKLIERQLTVQRHLQQQSAQEQDVDSVQENADVSGPEMTQENRLITEASSQPQAPPTRPATHTPNRKERRRLEKAQAASAKAAQRSLTPQKAAA